LKNNSASLAMADQPTWDPQTVAITADAFAGQTVVITGTLASMERKDAEQLVERAGGKATGTVSGRTNFLVAGEKAGSKLRKAQDLGVVVINEADFIARLDIEQGTCNMQHSKFAVETNDIGLRPLRDSIGAPGSLPKALRGIWNQLRSGSVPQILAGLDAFSVLVTEDAPTADVLLEEVGVDDATGTLTLGNRFHHAKEGLYPLLGVLSRSAEESRGAQLRQAVKQLRDCFPSLPEIRGFTALQQLEIKLFYANGSSPCPEAVQTQINESFDALPVLEALEIDDYHNLEITSLDGLIAPRLRRLNVTRVGHTDIQALAANTTLEEVTLRSNEQLQDISALIPSATSLHMLDVSRLKAAGALRDLKKLQSLVIVDSPAISSLSMLVELPALQSVQVRGCRNLSRLPAVWPSSLESLTLETCGITRLGTLPASLKGSLNLANCSKLTTLDGIEACTGLEEIIIPTSVNDLHAVAALPDAFINIDFCRQVHTLPDRLIDALAALPQCRLRFSDSGWPHPFPINNLEALSRITHLRALDLSSCELKDLLPVMGMGELEWLKIRPRSELSKKLGGCTFDTPGQVAKLQLLGLS
jgi:hypothetical protein